MQDWEQMAEGSCRCEWGVVWNREIAGAMSYYTIRSNAHNVFSQWINKAVSCKFDQGY